METQTLIKVAGERERLWREEEIGSLERADGRERVRWKKKEKCDHWQCLGVRASFILGAQRI